MMWVNTKAMEAFDINEDAVKQWGTECIHVDENGKPIGVLAEKPAIDLVKRVQPELAQAKKSLIESLPSLFDSPEAIAVIFAKGELLGKSYDHYLEYVKEINAVTADQVKAMVKKYFDMDKMTTSIVAPVSKLESIKPFTVIPQDSLEFR
jgi:hypothetical protein